MKTKSSLYAMLMVSACILGVSAADRFDYGKVVKGEYRNQFFNFRMKIPAKWFVQSKEQTAELMSRGRDIVAGDDENMKAMMKSSEVNSANLLTVFKYEPGSAVEHNPSVAVVAENVRMYPGIKTGKEYLFHLKKLLRQSKLKLDSMDEGTRISTVGGREFHLLAIGMNVLGKSVRQEYRAAVIDGFSFCVITTYVTDAERAELMGILGSMSFK